MRQSRHGLHAQVHARAFDPAHIDLIDVERVRELSLGPTSPLADLLNAARNITQEKVFWPLAHDGTLAKPSGC